MAGDPDAKQDAQQARSKGGGTGFNALMPSESHPDRQPSRASTQLANAAAARARNPGRGPTSTSRTPAPGQNRLGGSNPLGGNLDPKNPIFNPNARLGGQSLISAAQGLTQAEIQPLQNALNQTVGTLQKTGVDWSKLASGAYAAASTDIQNANDRIGQNNTGLQDQLAKIGAQASTSINKAGGLDALSRDAQSRPGLGGGGALSVQDTLAQLLGTSALNTQAAETYGAQRGANSVDYGAKLQGTSALRGLETQRSIAGRTQADVEKATNKANIGQQTSNLFGKNLLSLRDKAFTQNAALQTLGLKAGDLQVKAGTLGERVKNDAATQLNHERDRNQRALAAATAHGDRQAVAQERARHNRAVEQIRATTGGRGGSGRGGRQSAQGQRFVADIGSGVQLASELAGKGKTVDQIIQILRSGGGGYRTIIKTVPDPQNPGKTKDITTLEPGKGVDPLVARIAAEIAANGGISDQNLRNLMANRAGGRGFLPRQFLSLPIPKVFG